MKVHDLVSKLLFYNGQYDVVIGTTSVSEFPYLSEIDEVYVVDNIEGEKKVIIQTK